MRPFRCRQWRPTWPQTWGQVYAVITGARAMTDRTMAASGATMGARRSYKKIALEDLKRLAEIARWDREDLFRRIPRWGRLYADRVLCVALCQGAALHYVAGQTGMKDFDVWTFYRAHPAAPFPAQRLQTADFGDPKFGQSPDKPEFVGRRVDLIGRSIRCRASDDPLESLQAYLSSGRTQSARCLAEKAIVLLEPPDRCGQIIWPVGNDNDAT